MVKSKKHKGGGGKGAIQDRPTVCQARRGDTTVDKTQTLPRSPQSRGQPAVSGGSGKAPRSDAKVQKQQREARLGEA